LIRQKRKTAKSTISKSMVFRLAIGAFFTYLWYLNYAHVSSIEGLQSFDPYAILDLPLDADEKAIRKQYRRMSLTLHPDKNPDNPLAVQNFIRLTKAYNILTDETARENFQKYGNPDGPGSYHVAIAMPKFLLEPENQIPVLICAFFILLVVIPGIVYFNFADQTNKSDEGVLLENKRIFGSEIKETTLFKDMPLLISRSKEFQEMRARSKEENEMMRRIVTDPRFEDLVPKKANKQVRQTNLKPLCIILAHMFNLKEKDSELWREDYEYIRKMTPQMLIVLSQVVQEI